MKKNYFANNFVFTSVIILASFLNANAQYSFSPSTTLIKNQDLNSMTYDSIHIANNSTDTLLLNWELISVDSIAGTYFDFCAAGNCYLGIPDTGSFPDIAPGQFGWIGMHFWTGNTPVTCTAKVRVFEPGNSIGGDTLTFIINASPSNGINSYNALSNSTFIYPNPASDNISIRTSENSLVNVYIYNSWGQLIQETNNSNSISLKDLNAGTYFVTIKDKSGNYFTRIIEKSNY